MVSIFVTVFLPVQVLLCEAHWTAIYYKKDGKEIKSIIIIIIMLCEIQALAQTAGLETSSF
jgi:hypothetical protein